MILEGGPGQGGGRIDLRRRRGVATSDAGVSRPVGARGVGRSRDGYERHGQGAERAALHPRGLVLTG
jgi:hypothetical protein